MTVRDNVLVPLDAARAIIAGLGLRRYAVTVRVRTWSGGRPGAGAATNADLALSPTPRVRTLAPREVAASGGTYEEGDYRVDKITPAFSGPPSGGYTPAQLNPEPGADQDVVVLLGGDDGAKVCTLVGAPADRAFGYELIVRPRREAP
jgi:hypothetical protein